MRVLPASAALCTNDRARACFLRACALDVAVRKPGNVSQGSPGHRMQAEMFIASSEAAAGPLFRSGARVGARIEAAVMASFAAAGCNTNLGILLLCAPIALAIERRPDATTPAALRAAIGAVLADLDLADAQGAYRAIALVEPGGLGTVATEDVRRPPSVDLRAAMAIAAPRDAVARQYRDGYADLFDVGLAALGKGFSLTSGSVSERPDAACTAAVQRLYLTLLGRFADSHIVRIHGEALAHIVMTAAQAWMARAGPIDALDNDPEFARWDARLKADRINPGTTADLTVATLLIAGLSDASWHGS
ncbi:MAG: triphosphoribosyl-dephospho-CoA synthase [Burkholderiaceae bacterium]